MPPRSEAARFVRWLPHPNCRPAKTVMPMTATTATAFTWKFGSNDVLTAGDYEVQFTAAFVLGNIVSAPSQWKVYAAIVV